MIARFGMIAVACFVIAWGAMAPLRQGVADILLSIP